MIIAIDHHPDLIARAMGGRNRRTAAGDGLREVAQLGSQHSMACQQAEASLAPPEQVVRGIVQDFSSYSLRIGRVKLTPRGVLSEAMSKAEMRNNFTSSGTVQWENL